MPYRSLISPQESGSGRGFFEKMMQRPRVLEGVLGFDPSVYHHARDESFPSPPDCD